MHGMIKDACNRYNADSPAINPLFMRETPGLSEEKQLTDFQQVVLPMVTDCRHMVSGFRMVDQIIGAAQMAASNNVDNMTETARQIFGSLAGMFERQLSIIQDCCCQTPVTDIDRYRYHGVH